MLIYAIIRFCVLTSQTEQDKLTVRVKKFKGHHYSFRLHVHGRSFPKISPNNQYWFGFICVYDNQSKSLLQLDLFALNICKRNLSPLCLFFRWNLIAVCRFISIFTKSTSINICMERKCSETGPKRMQSRSEMLSYLFRMQFSIRINTRNGRASIFACIVFDFSHSSRQFCNHFKLLTLRRPFFASYFANLMFCSIIILILGCIMPWNSPV